MSTDNHTILELRVPKDSEETPEAAAQLFLSLPKLRRSLWQILTFRERPLSFEIACINQTIYFLVVAPTSIQLYLESQLAASYPKIALAQLRDYLPERNQLRHPKVGQLVLEKVSYLPLKTYQDFKDTDPLATVLGTLSKAKPEDFIVIQYLITPAPKNWHYAGQSAIDKGVPTADRTFKPLPQANIIDKKISEAAFRVGIRILTDSDSKARSQDLLGSVAGSFGSFRLGEGNSLQLKTPTLKITQIINALKKRSFSSVPRKQYLTVSELATLYHLPNENLSKIKNIAWGITLLGEPPENLPVAADLVTEEKQNINFFAKTEFKNRATVFGIKKDDRRRHIYIIGKTGTGKSTLIANMAVSDLKNRHGVAIIDPHGDLIDLVLDYIPSYRINDVCYFNPADQSHSVKINPLEVREKEHAELVASGIVAIFQKLYHYSWGPRLEHILRNTLLTLVTQPNTTLLDVTKILTDQHFRKLVVSKLNDEVLKRFWQDEFAQMGERLRSEAISPILNKVGQFIASPLIRNVLNSPKSSINIEDHMNQGKILIANLSQGKLGEDNSSLLGAMLITKIQLAAMNRINLPEAERRDFYLYVDEFQNFATTSFIKILSEARKYRLNLALANQYIAQVPEDVQKAIFGNIGTLISFIVGAQDAPILEREYGENYQQKDLVSLGRYQIIVKLAIDNRTSTAFPAYTLPLAKSRNENRAKVIQVSRERFAKAFPKTN